MDKEIKIGIITSDSLKYTAMNSLINHGGYNQLRAHGLGVCDFIREVKNLGKNIIPVVHDIGESIHRSEEYVSDDPILEKYNWDMSMHLGDDLRLKECTIEDFLSSDTYNIIIMLYTYVGEDNKDFINYIKTFMIDDRLNEVIYYASDDEMCYPGYFLEGLLRDHYNKDPWLNLWGELDHDKITMILSGHSYCVDYHDLCSKCYHAPMYANKNIIQWCDNNLTNDKEYDYFLNVFHDSRIADPYIELCKNTGKKMLILTNDVVGKYLTATDNCDIYVSKGRNCDLRDIIKLANKCKTYLIPNTYKHLSNYYNDKYLQDIMYTHKFLESIYSKCNVVGDVTDLYKMTPLEFNKSIVNEYCKSPMKKIVKLWQRRK